MTRKHILISISPTVSPPLTPICEIGSVYPSHIYCCNRPSRHPILKVGVSESYDVQCLLTQSYRYCNATNLGIEIPGIHFQDQNTAMTIIEQ